MNDEMIYIEVSKGRSLRDVAKEFGVSKDRVDYIKKNGDYYTDITDVKNVKRDVFCSKIPSEKEQLSLIIFSYNDVWMKNEYKLRNIHPTASTKMFDSKSLITRIALYLDVDRSTVYRWCTNKKKRKLVKEELRIMFDSILDEFYDKERETMGKTYYVDDNGYVKGHKLYYLNYDDNPKLAYYINKYARCFALSEQGATAFENHYLKKYKDKKAKDGEEVAKSLEYVVRLSIKCGILLGKWIREMMVKGYEYKEIVLCLKEYEFNYEDAWYTGDLCPPLALYYENKGLTFVPEDLKSMMKEQEDERDIVGVFQ